MVTRTMGLDPITAGLIAQLGAPLLKNLLGGDQAAAAAAIAAQQKAAEAATMQRWMIAGGLLAGVAVLAIALRR